MVNLKSGQTKETLSYGNRYDAKAKSIFSRKSVMSHVIKAIVPEFKDMAPMDIQGYFAMDELHGNRIFTSDSVSKFEGLKEIRSDLRFRMRNPKSGESISVRFEFDYEIQNKHNPGYSLHKRGIYYCARILDEQLGAGKDYDSLQKVYSIWVITDAAKEKRGTVETITLKDENGNTLPEFDLLSLSYIHLNVERGYESDEKNLINYLTAIFKGDSDRLRKYFSEEQFEIVEGDINNMNGFLVAAMEEGMEKGIEKEQERLVRNLIRTSRNRGMSDFEIRDILASSEADEDLVDRLLAE